MPATLAEIAVAKRQHRLIRVMIDDGDVGKRKVILESYIAEIQGLVERFSTTG